MKMQLKLKILKKIAMYILLGLIIIVIIREIYLSRIKKKTATSFEDLSSEEITELINKAKLENEERVLNVKKICKRYNSGTYRSSGKWPVFRESWSPYYSQYFFDFVHKFAFCPTFKAASSTWLYHLAIIAGSTDEEIANSIKSVGLIGYVRKLFPPLDSSTAVEFLANSLNFFVVRHPFERILSAYRDKLESLNRKGDTSFYNEKFGKKIVSTYRKGGFSTNVRDLLKEGQYIWKDGEEPVGTEPTFKEFVRFLIDTDVVLQAEEHWMPMHALCTPCLVNYNIIGKVETMLQDQLLIIHTLGMEKKIKPRWEHKTNPINETNYNNVSEVAKIYFSQLNQNDVIQLYEQYKLDFELFQYGYIEYYKYIGK